jgi:hypothetical protein
VIPRGFTEMPCEAIGSLSPQQPEQPSCSPFSIMSSHCKI